MTKREIASLSCKLLSIFALISALGTLQYFFDYFGTVAGFAAPQSTKFEPWVLFSSAMPFVLQTTVALFLWLISDGLAVVMAKDDGAMMQQNATASLNRSDVLQLAFTIIGVFQISQAVPVFLDAAANRLIPHPGSVSLIIGNGTPYIFGSLVQLAIGLYLLSGARNLVRSVVARHARYDNAPPPL